VESYRSLRQNDKLGRGQSAYRITVRQLESIVRLSEALAKLHLESEVKEVRRTPCSFLESILFGPMSQPDTVSRVPVSRYPPATST
jgi:hypothetical protein